MSSVYFGGSILVAPGTPRNVGTISATGGNYQFVVDCGNMADGDETELRVANVMGPGGTVSLQYDGAYADRQAQQLKTSEPFSVTRSGAQVSIQMSAGGARWFPYDVITIS